MTNEELAAHIIDMKSAQAATQATLAAFTTAVTQRLDAQDIRMNAQGDRLRSVERGRWITVGVAGTLSALGSWILSKLHILTA